MNYNNNNDDDDNNYNYNYNNDYSASSPSPSPSNPDVLLQLVEELTMAVDEVTPELYQKMEQVELSLAIFLEEKSNSLNSLSSTSNKPPPPTIPPPTKALFNNYNNNNNSNALSNDLLRAEQALEKLRQRLKKEEEALFQAEQILQRSMEEQDILRRAEEALQKSRQAAEQRRQQQQQRQQQQPPPPTTTRPRPRPTMELGALFGSKKPPSRTTTNGNSNSREKVGMIPLLYNWIQYDDGSIRGNVKGSPNFDDGATISTSAVQLGAQDGSVITTSSGSQ
jgi:hypothetical protein